MATYLKGVMDYLDIVQGEEALMMGNGEICTTGNASSGEKHASVEHSRYLQICEDCHRQMD